MSLTVRQRLDRLNVRLAELEYWRARETKNVEGWTFDGAPIALNGFWPDRDGVKHFAASADVPAGWPLDEARLCLNEHVAETADDIDLAMVLGTGYAPFRGGPLQYQIDNAMRPKAQPQTLNAHESLTHATHRHS